MLRGVAKAALCVLSAVAFSQSCGNSPTSPSGSISVALVFAAVTTGDTFTATLNGKTYTAYGPFLLNLSPGTYQVTGSFVGGGLAVGFGGGTTTTTGGVQSGSVRTLQGPEPEVDSCAAYYFYSPALFGGARVRQDFKVEFKVTSSQGSACQ